MRLQSRSSGFNRPDKPLNWQDFDVGNVIVRNPVVRSYSDEETCEHCGALTHCEIVGSANGQKYLLCKPCAERRLAHERERFGQPRRMSR